MLEKYYSGAGIENISKEKINNIYIPIPPIEIQNKIIKQIEEIEYKTKKLTEEINNNYNLIKNLIN